MASGYGPFLRNIGGLARDCTLRRMTGLLLVVALTGCGERLGAPGATGPEAAAIPEPAPAEPPDRPEFPDGDFALITTLAGDGLNGITGEGIPPLQTSFSLPQDLAIGPDGLPYLVDWNNHRVRVIRNGVVETVAGTGSLGVPVDGPALASPLDHPTHVSFDPQGRMLISAWHNAVLVRVDPSTGMLSHVAGTGVPAFSGDGGPALGADLDLPLAAVATASGAIVFMDQGNLRIRRIGGNGVVRTICGTGAAGFSGDGGPAAGAELNLPGGHAAAPVGRLALWGGYLYFCDSLNSVVRRFHLGTGVIETVAGTPLSFGYSGDGGAATSAVLNAPADVEVDARGNLYIADTFNSCIRRVDADGRIRTVAGTGGTSGYSGDGGSPFLALLDRPYGIALDDAGNLYVADTHNHRFRVLTR